SIFTKKNSLVSEKSRTGVHSPNRRSGMSASHILSNRRSISFRRTVSPFPGMSVFMISPSSRFRACPSLALDPLQGTMLPAMRRRHGLGVGGGGNRRWYRRRCAPADTVAWTKGHTDEACNANPVHFGRACFGGRACIRHLCRHDLEPLW